MPATARQTEGPGPWSYWWVPGRAPRFQNAAHTNPGRVGPHMTEELPRTFFAF